MAPLNSRTKKVPAKQWMGEDEVPRQKEPRGAAVPRRNCRRRPSSTDRSAWQDWYG